MSARRVGGLFYWQTWWSSDVLFSISRMTHESIIYYFQTWWDSDVFIVNFHIFVPKSLGNKDQIIIYLLPISRMAYDSKIYLQSPPHHPASIRGGLLW